MFQNSNAKTIKDYKTLKKTIKQNIEKDNTTLDKKK